METQNNFLHQPNQPIAFLRPVMIGAGIALLVILFFVLGADNPKPEWGQYWMIRPLIITPLAGALGGAIYAYLSYQSSRGFNRPLALLLSTVIYLVGLWMGVVLGLAGTMWD